MDQTSIAMPEQTNIASEQALVYQRTENRSKRFYNIEKRTFDIIFSIIGLVLSAPVFLLVALLIKADSKGPVFFKHKRIGLDNKPLYIYKFRSMAANADEMFQNFTAEQRNEFLRNYKLDHDPRITRVGKFIRETSIDELPQLVNVLKGDLSLVGPRPVVNDEIARYGINGSLLLSVKPGLTGYWQANCRSAVSYKERMAMELYYVQHASFWFDMKIVLITVSAVLQKRGAQ